MAIPVICFSRERVTPKLIDELVPIIAAHYHEIANFKQVACEPDFSRYEALDKAGFLRVYTARLDGKLVGYSVFSVLNPIHFKRSLQAHEDLLFLDPKMRKGLDGYRFIRWCDQELTKEGVEVIYHHVKRDHNHGALLERQGYELVDMVWGKYVKREESPCAPE